MSQSTKCLGSIVPLAMFVCNNYPSISQVVLEEAKIKEAPKLECPSTPAPSVEDIEKRLKEAENRRKSMEASTLEKLAQEEKKREEVRAKKASVSETEEKEEEKEEAA